ncbi:MAG TPA: TolC family protein [Gemmatimonadaceae bacterium]|nr:TolC family protein [Gemmatimonadaceae bacterium]
MHRAHRPALAVVLLIAGAIAAPRAARAQLPRASGDSLRAAGTMVASPAATMVAAPADTLHLGALEDAAVRADPRSGQLALQAEQSALRLRTLAAERLPALSVEGQAQHQSDVVRVPILLPNGERVPSPPYDTYDAHVGAQESLFDPTRAPRRAVEHARLAEEQAGVRATLHDVRLEVEENFFTAALLQSRASELAASGAALEARLAEARTRVREGAALPSDSATIAAALLQRRQSEAEARADRGAALARLTELTGRAISDRDSLALPNLDSVVARARESIGTPDAFHGRPELDEFAAARERLARQAAVADAGAMPRVSAFARAGYGRPGLNLLGSGFDSYWLAGVQVRWTPWSWGTTSRERQELELQQRIVQAGEAAFTAGLRRAIAGDLATIDRLHGTLATDDQVIALRERVERETGARLREGVATGADYVDRSTELLSARLTRDAHRVELARAQAHLLTTLGVEVR